MNHFTLSRLIMSLILAILPFVASGQTISVKGTVVDASGEGLPGAIVKVKGTQIADATDIEGNFHLSNVPKGSTIITTFMGTKDSQEKAAHEMRIVMQEIAENLDEVLVVAFGKQKREAFTGSAGVIKADEIEKQVVNDPVSALDGHVPGV